MCRYWTDCSPATALAPLTAALELTYVAGPDPADRAVVGSVDVESLAS